MSWGHSSSIFGGSTSHLNPSPAALANNPHSQASMSMGQLAQHAQQQFNNVYSQQGMANNAYNQNSAAFQHQQMIANLGRTVGVAKRYMIDGVLMDFDEFVDALYPDDCAEKTHIILKFKKDE